MAAWTFKGESGKSFVDTAVTLESQGVSSATVSFRSLEPDILTLEYQVADYAASSTLPELRQTISLYRDSDRFFYGNVIRVSPKVDANSSTVIVEVAGPWWWLDRIPMTSSQVDGEGNSATRPSFVFGDFADGGDMAINLTLAIDRAIDLGAPLIKGTISNSFQVPRITLNQSTCGDVISELVRLIPDTMVWFDYSGTGYATLNISRRADASTPKSMFTLSPNLVTNGDFVSDISGWTKSGDAASTIEWDNGRLKVNAATNYDGAVQSASGLVSGKVYKFSADYEFGTATQLQIRAGSEPSTDLSSPSSGTAVNYFTASSATMSIYIRTGGSTGTMFFDNISIVQVPSVPSGSDSVSTDLTAMNIQPLIELEVSQVKVPFVTRATTGETQYTTQDSGSSATGKVEILPVSGPELVDFLPNDQLDTIKIANAYDGDTAGLALAVKKDVYPGWADVVASVAGSEGTNYGLDCTDTFVFGAGGSTITVFRNLSSSVGGTTEVYPAGTTTLAQTAIPAGKKFVCFENGQQPPQWAIDDYSLTEYFPNVISWFDQNLSGSTYNQARRYAILDATEWSLANASTSNTGIDNSGAGTYMFAIWLPEKSVKLWLCDTAKIPADNTLIRGADFTFAAPPANFAANLLAAQNYVPHEGAIELTSSDTGATRFRGTKVRVTGSLSTMTAMDALVSGETLDIREGSTQVELGQPPRLDFLEFVNRVRRTPQDNTQYVADAVSGVTPLLDATDVPAATIAASTRKLRAAYSGHCMKIRRTSDSAQANVAFDSDGLLSYYSAITVTSGSSTAQNLAQFTNGTDAHVVTFYDQSGNGRDFAQGTASAQPKIVSNGKLIDPTFERTSSTAGDFMTSSYTHSSLGSDPFTYCAVCKSATLDNPSLPAADRIFGLMSDISNYNKGVEIIASVGFWRSHVMTTDLASTFTLDTDQDIILSSYINSGSNNHKMRKNGSEQTRTTSRNITNRQAFSIGTRRTTATLQTWDGTIPEVVTFESQLNSTQVAALEGNMSEFYGITLA
jgi:hypothetical protein